MKITSPGKLTIPSHVGIVFFFFKAPEADVDVSTEEPPKVEKVQDGVFVDVHVGQEKNCGMFKMDMYTIYLLYILYHIIYDWKEFLVLVDKQSPCFSLHMSYVCFLRMPFVYVGHISCDEQKFENKLYTTRLLIPGSLFFGIISVYWR